jgi:NitT/TauT family transport system permease protein
MKKIADSIKTHYQTPLTIISFFILWQVSVVLFSVREFILPSPLTAILRLLVPQPNANYHWLVHIKATLIEVFLSFIVTAVVGILLAILISWSKRIRDLLLPFFVFVNSLPIIAVAPIFLLWMGYGIATNILIAFLVSFFPIVINTATGMGEVDEDLLDLVRYLKANQWQIFIKIRFPNALPYIFSGLKISSTMCVVGAIVGEFLASDKGLGYIIINSQFSLDTPAIFAALILVSLIGFLLFGLVSLIENLVMPWYDPGKEKTY